MVIHGDNQSGHFLRVRGYINNVRVLEAGDYLSYDHATGRSLHMVVEGADTDGAGRARIRIEPPIRAAGDDGEHVETDRPTCRMRLNDDMTGSMLIGLRLAVDVNISLVEAF